MEEERAGDEAVEEVAKKEVKSFVHPKGQRGYFPGQESSVGKPWGLRSISSVIC